MTTNLLRSMSRMRVILATIAIVFVALSSAIYFATRVSAASTTILISEFRTRGTNGGNDEFIELYNATSSPIDISGWKINGSSNAGVTSTRVTINAGTSISAHGHFLAVNNGALGYSGAVAGNQTYATGVADDGGIAVLNPSNSIIDAVGMSAGSAYKEGTTLAQLNTNVNRSYERKPGGTNGSGNDTDNNSADFQILTPSAPQNLASPPTVGNQPINTTCPTPLNTTQGIASSVGVSASDPDGTVVSAAITSAPVAGITLDSFTPAGSVGGTASATLRVGDTTAAGNHNVKHQYLNNKYTTSDTNTNADTSSRQCRHQSGLRWWWQ